MERQKGLALVELMIAMLIGLVITGAVLQVFLSNKTTYLLQDAMGRVQDNGRFALQFLATEIRPAGNSVGIRFPESQICVATNAAQSLGADVARAVSGFRATNQSINGLAVLPGTDVISISRTDACQAWVTGNWKPANANFKASTYCASMGKGRAMMVFDLTQAVVFSITNNPGENQSTPTLTHAGSNNANSDCGGHRFDGITFDNTARIVAFGNNSYFVANTGRTDPQGRPVRALWMTNNLAPIAERGPFEVVEGVESMRIAYGVATANGAAVDRYIPTDSMTAGDWPNVRAVKMQLLLASEQSVAGAAGQAVSFDGTAIAPDGRIRQVYSTVIALRNRTE